MFLSSESLAIAMQPLQKLLDKGVTRSTTAAALCARLEGRCLQVEPASIGTAVHLCVNDGRLLLRPGAAEAPDATLSGTPLALLRLAGSDPQAAIRDGDVRMSGDAEVADDFRALLDIVRPDWEEELSRLTGDVIAHEAGRVVRHFGNWAQRARHSRARSTAEYLTEESRDLAATTEIDEFCTAVDRLSADVDRAEARLIRLRERAAPQ